MDNESTNGTEKSTIVWDELEAWVREHVQRFIQGLLEDEVTELLARGKHERRAAVDAPVGYRNGYGKPRRLTLSCGTIEVRRPRVRDLDERFESRLLPLFAKRTKQVGELLPELYLHGLALGDFDLALGRLLGEGAALSPSTIARLKTKWQGEYEAWRTERLDELEPVYLWVDGVYVKAGLEKDKAALLVAIAGCADGRKRLVALVAGHRESEAAWSAVLRDLKRRGLGCPKLVEGDGHLGIWAGLRNVYPEAAEQRCWNHRILNVLDTVPKKRQAQAKLQLKQIPYADTEAEALRLRERFQAWCRTHGLDEAAALIEHDWDRMVAFYRFPREHWTHLRTTNVVESPFGALRLRTDAAKRFKKVENATAVIFKMLKVAETRFRRLNAPELLRQLALGAEFKDGLRVQHHPEEAAA
jgi:transposase-like protein